MFKIKCNESMRLRFMIFVVSSFDAKCICRANRQKKRVVINIRDLNKISQFDVYSMQQQIDIIATIMKCSYIFLINATTFFHQ